jgi:hypothetical protein
MLKSINIFYFLKDVKKRSRRRENTLYFEGCAPFKVTLSSSNVVSKCMLCDTLIVVIKKYYGLISFSYLTHILLQIQ